MASLNQSQRPLLISDNGSLTMDIQKGSSMNTETTSTAGVGIKTLNDYQEKAWSYALPTAKESSYLFPGIAAEVGELCGVQAKYVRDNPTSVDMFSWENRQEALKKELGDILWFVAGIASNYYWKLEDIAQMNINKLEDRKQRNVIQGSGDNR
jgi:NTP pyrophosphatase (non-canonical NTP hydrolase)